MSDGAVPAVPDLRGVHLAAGDGQGDAGDLRAADEGAPTEGKFTSCNPALHVYRVTHLGWASPPYVSPCSMLALHNQPENNQVISAMLQKSITLKAEQGYM